MRGNNIFDLTDSIIQDLKEETSSADISYIPDGFLNTKTILRAMAGKKTNWKVDILEDGDEYKVNFENRLKIKIPKKDYEHFNTNVLDLKGLKEANLTCILNEAFTDQVNTVADELTRTLTVDLRKIFEIEQSIFLVSAWHRLFGGEFTGVANKPLIRISNYDKDVLVLVKKIKDWYGDDVGQMEMVIEAIKEKNPLNSYDVFATHEYIVGERISSNVDGNRLILEIAVNSSFQPVQTIWVDNPEIIEEMSYYNKYVKASNKNIYPVNKMFNVSIFEALKDVVDSL